ncbi:hypothetical protein APHAL10511_001156 [Amanita phalloides]|nr:hypothetical protein APHAL10511_001156 [Amanita phalloides]
MATRRLPLRVAKPITGSSNAQSSKSRYLTAKAARSVDEGQSSQPEQSHTVQRLNKSSDVQDECETNIQVVIRCRRRSEHEIRDNSPIIVTSAGAKSKELIIEAAAPVSSLGILQLPPTRKYNFDMVFGPEADQAMLYHDVVHPMLEEVLLGYNCTLFAYGQTGTGKTYTMQGDLTPTPMGNPSPNAGMIPRVLFRLFHKLEKSEVDYSVKVSFVELYNEELRDLLATELSAPSGSTQPMGAGVKDNLKSQESTLKIFDDANKKGVIIQGLEEIAVRDSQDALALLTKGSLRRQIAATKFNDHSSRSHSVFSIIVHTKEISSIGDDLLRVGKLNLVDLAGSENIGRSGAENKRAREAGMINQSLLTLGRVINALVDKAHHVPYRESKLTRLLQDSLGGNTKTCVVATVSPARSNMEETLSTLDYALRAKSIRNKPELNQRMSRNALLKDYISEIERLKADILATREKNGIYFSEENWKQICDQQELRATELAEAKKQVEIVEKELRSVRDEYDESIGLLKRRENELKHTREKLAEREDLLARTEVELGDVRVALEEETIIRKAHQHTEVVLDGVASGLNKVVKDSLHDISDLFSKLARKQAILTGNSRAVTLHGNSISTSRDALVQTLSVFIESAMQHVDRVHCEAKQFEVKHTGALTAQANRIEKHLQQLAESIASIHKHDSAESAVLQALRSTLQETIISLQTESAAWNEKWTKSSQRQHQIIENLSKEVLTSLENALNSMTLTTESILKEALHFIEVEQNLMQKAKFLAEDVNNAEIQRLKKQNQVLLQLLDDEKQKSQKSQSDMVQRISSMLGDYVNERDRSLRQAIGLVHDENNEATNTLSTFTTDYDQIMARNRDKALNVNSALREKSQEYKRTREGVLKSFAGVRQSIGSNFETIHATASEAVASYAGKIQQSTQTMSSSCATSFEEHGRVKRARLEEMSSMTSDMQGEHGNLSNALESMTCHAKSATDNIISETISLRDLTSSHQMSISTQLDNVQSAVLALNEEGTKDDTGPKPQKRVWEFVGQWDLTKSRSEILKEWRGRAGETEGSMTSPKFESSVDTDDEAGRATRHPKSPTPDLVTSSESPASLISSFSSTTSIPITARPTGTQSLATKKATRSVMQPPTALVDLKTTYSTRASRRK